MARYIDADMLGVGHCSENVLPHAYCVAWNSLVDLINNTPTADVAEVKHGEWVEVDDGVIIGDGKHLECSECGTWKKDKQRSNYCPNCGAKMDGGIRHMIKLEHTETFNWEGAVRGMRNPHNSWEQSDSGFLGDLGEQLYIGEDDLALMKKLAKAGSDHRKFMRQIFVSVDITAPLYWWKEFDTYKVGTVANSCSTMHTIHKKEFELDDFSHEHLDVFVGTRQILCGVIHCLNELRDIYNEEKDRDIWYQIIQLLPSSYNQKRTVTMNYENLMNMYHARKNHKLDEWREFCGWIEGLPYSEIITGKDE